MAKQMVEGNPVMYSQLPVNPDNTHYVVVLPNYHQHHPCAAYFSLRRCLCSAAAILILCLAVFLLYPSDPQLQLVRVKLNSVKVNSSPPPLSLDISFNLTIKVRNRDLFSLDYNSLDVSIGYRGRELGVVKSDGGFVRARASSYVNATVDMNGLQIVHDVFFLLEDLARGSIPFDTVSRVEGKLGLFFFKIPIKAQVSCEVQVSTKNQTVIHQDCYPE